MADVVLMVVVYEEVKVADVLLLKEVLVKLEVEVADLVLEVAVLV